MSKRGDLYREALDLELARIDRITELEEALAEAQRNGWCDVCAGTGKPTSDMPCICGGTGQAADAVNGFRKQLAEAQQALNDLEIDLNCATFAMPTNNETTAEDRIDWLCEQIHEAQQARERAETDSRTDEAALMLAFEALELVGVADSEEHGQYTRKWLTLSDRIHKLAKERDTLLGLLRRASEELRLLHMKDTSVIYDVGLRVAITAALPKEPR